MRSFVIKNKYFLVLTLIFIVSEIIVNPTGEFPLNDDWSYAKSVMTLQNEGRLDLGQWPAMTLVTHLIWGLLFTKVFGFSFVVLHFSTMVSSLIGVFVLNKLVLRITKNPLAAFLASLILLFNPFYFNLTNTYMTDVNFNTLMLLCCYFAYDFFEKASLFSLILVFVISAALVLMRQFGIIVPACFLFSCLFLQEKKWFFTGISFSLLIVVYLVLKYYESYLITTLAPESAYKFSGTINPSQRVFWDIVHENFILRYPKILFHVFFYSFPFAVLFLPAIVKRVKPITLFITVILSVTAVYFFFRDEGFQMSNIFNDMALGTETFYETLKGTNGDNGHTYSPGFDNIMIALKYIFISGTLITISLFLLGHFRVIKARLAASPGIIFLLGVFFAYSFMILLTESFFDRYHVPLITLGIILLSFMGRRYKVNYRIVIVPLILLAYVSVFGTKDYYMLNSKRWEAYAYLKNVEKIDADKINGGFEVNCWNDGKQSWWWMFMSLDNFNYLIQYNSEPGFILYKEYEFQRYFPFKKDKINIFVRQGTLN